MSFDPAVMMSERSTADRNNALGFMMKESGTFEDDVNLHETLELYFSTCSITATNAMMATAAASLANGGVNPFTRKQVFSKDNTRSVISLMLSCGMYDFSGEWAFTVGIPAKSAVSTTPLYGYSKSCEIGIIFKMTTVIATLASH